MSNFRARVDDHLCRWWKGKSPKIKSDEFYLRVLNIFRMHKFLNLKHPKTFNEKLQWLKLYAYRPEYAIMADKVKAKEYVAMLIGSDHVIPTLGVWEKAEDVNFDDLPSKFVIKCNHNSGTGMYICKDKSVMDSEHVRSKLKEGLLEDYFYPGRDKQYRDIPRRILAEQYLEDDNGSTLSDYKIHCFEGKPRFILVCRDRFESSGLTEDFYSVEWEHLPIKRPGTPNAEKPMPKPDELEEMLKLAGLLSKDIPFVRVDFYLVKGNIYFGEMTFFPAGGMGRFEPSKWDRIFGDYINLPQ